MLGELRVISGEERLELGGLRERRALAMLLLEAGHVVPARRLIDAVWGENPPADAKRGLANVIYRLRRALGSDRGPDIVLARAGGYLISIADAKLDAAEFEQAVTEANRLVKAGDLEQAAETLRRALEWWRGPALSGLGADVLDAAAVRWNELRLTTQISYATLLLDLGLAEKAVAEIAALVAEHPLRENVVILQMTALYRCGRQRDALELYAATRNRLVDELGIEPSPTLRDLHGRILGNDPELVVPREKMNSSDSGSFSSRALSSAPRQMPAAARHFTGRSKELEILDRMLHGGETTVDREKSRLAVISGMAGVGKTTLALYWAHRSARDFPHGQLYANLRGFGPSAEPVRPQDVICNFLHALGVPPEKIATDPEAQANQYRSILSGAHVLLVLDNARDAQQVRPLLPGSTSCLTVVTSRDRLIGLVASDCAEPVSLDGFSTAESHEFLAKRLGPQAVEREPQPAEELIRFSARLPLALSVIAARAVIARRTKLEALVAQLRETRHRLDALRTSDDATDPRVAFSWSHRNLSPASATMFEILATHPGSELGRAAARSLAGDCVQDVDQALAELVSAHLVEEVQPGRYAIHDLLRSYGEELAVERLWHASAVRRLIDHYLRAAYAAERAVDPWRDPIELPAGAEGVCLEEIADADDATRWFDAEDTLLVGLVGYAIVHGEHARAWRLAWCLSNHLRVRGRYDALVNLYVLAIGAAESTGELDGQGRIHSNLGFTLDLVGLHDRARAHLERALELFTAAGNRVDVAHVSRGLARVMQHAGDAAGALRHLETAKSIYREEGHTVGLAAVLNVTGWMRAQLRDLDSALTDCRESLALLADLEMVDEELANTLDSLGYIHTLRGEFTEAVDYFERALALFHTLGNAFHIGDTSSNLAEACRAGGDLQAARRAWHVAAEAFDSIGHPRVVDVRAKIAGAAADS